MNIPKKQCCGCGACANICPTRCISMREDEEGFLYPVTDTRKCVGCGLCEKVCVSSGKDAPFPTQSVTGAFGAYTLDEETRRNSSSGGIFHELARRTLKKGGCVFGVAMDKDCKGASFIKAETEEELQKIMTSKYLQASVRNAYREAGWELKAGREVLFSGTPCHINALRLYLRNSDANEENLFCVDVICHGTPSPKVWRKYVNEFERTRNAALKSVSFRCKKENWRDFGMSLQSRETLFIPAEKCPYMKLFLSNYSLRPSCYACVSKVFRLSDMTLGDFWGIENVLPALDDGKGTSLVLIRTEKGQRMFEGIRDGLRHAETTYSDAVRYNSPEYESVGCPPNRGEFFRDADKLTLEELRKKYVRLSLYRRIRTRLDGIRRKFQRGGVNKIFRYGLLMEFTSAE